MNKHTGSSMRSLFDELGETDRLELLSRKKMLTDQLLARMARTHVTQAMLAKAMKTSRAAVHRLLDPTEKGVTLDTLVRASSALGLELSVSFRTKGSPRKVGPKTATPRVQRASGGEPRPALTGAKTGRRGVST